MTHQVQPPASVLRHCREVTRTRARNFYYGLKLLPEPQRSALYAVYAWMRMADDLVDDESVDAACKQQRLEAFRAKTEQAIAGKPSDDDPMWAGLAYVVQQFSLQRDHLNAMLEGQLADVHELHVDTFETLRAYCYNVASTVGLVCIEIWGYHDTRAPELAIERGVAFQLTNILRDFREDFDSGRVYLPADEFAQHGLDAHDLRHWAKPDACRALMQMHIARVESFYQKSAALDGMITSSCRPTLWAMTSIYRGILEKIKTDPQQIMSPQRVRLSALHKVVIAVKARWLRPAEPAKLAVDGADRS
jgi:phytoene synthase